jgi:class 3 adenylate cyclase/ligand-binding sensor domain-containing protein
MSAIFRSMWRAAIPVLVGLCSTLPLRAQQYDLRNYSLEQGLASASVNAVAEDADGFLWVATDNGIARGQGSRFEAFDRDTLAPGRHATALLAARDATGGNLLWVGFQNGTIGRWEKGRFTNWHTRKPLPAFPVRRLLPGAGNTLWMASRGGGIWSVDTVIGSVTERVQGLPTMRINHLAQQAGGTMLAALDSGLFRWNDSRWEAVDLQGELRGRRVLCIWSDSLGTILGTSDGYLELDQQLRPLPPAARYTGFQPLLLPHPVVISVLRVPGGALWLGTPAGLVHITRRGGVPELTTMAEANGLGHDLVRCLHRDRSGGIWAGTGFGGISKFTSDAFRYVTERDGLGSRIVSAIHRSPEGLLWFATQGGGISQYDGHAMRKLGRAEGLPSLFITALGEDPQGYLLAGTNMHGLHRWNVDRFEPVELPGTRMPLRVNAIELAPDGSVHVGTDQGAYRMHNGTWAGSAIPVRNVTALHTDTTATCFATDSGAFMRSAMGTPQRLPAPAIMYNAVVRDSKGGVWLGSEEQGLFHVLDGKVTRYGLEHGLESLAVEALLLDAFENLWLGTKRGVHLVELDVLQEHVLDITAYGPEDGFIGLETLPGAVLLDTDSSLWFGTVRGAIRYEPRAVIEDPQAPATHLLDLQLFYEHPDWSPWCTGTAGNGLPNGLELPHDRNHLTFVFAGISLAYPEKVRYRWMLEGYDRDWSDITATQRVTYSNIPPGDYSFKVMARNASGIWNEVPVSYSFSIAPPFWQTNGFRIGGGACLLLLVLGSIRVRERNLRRERERLERMVVQRTSELASEKDRSDRLLLNILPASTAEELKQKGSAKARRYEHCTVLFSDFKGFSTFSSRMDSDTLVAELDHFFRLFDQLCERYGLEKIKTIGDAYMCAAGLPEPTDGHALNALLMGLGMLEAVEQSNAERRAKGLQEWPVRIGLHSGPVVAGVVGERKFAYDIWGDTVNVASRMESNGEAGLLNISGPVYAQVMDYIEVRPRGPIRIKGKGEVQMYFVERLRPEFSADERGWLPVKALPPKPDAQARQDMEGVRRDH